MKLHQEFTIARPLGAIWALFKDVPTVAACLPGAEYLGPKDANTHLGKVTTKVGPFNATFEGDAQVRYDENEKTIQMEGKGVDRKGASRGKMTMTCKLEPVGETTKVVVDTDLQLLGTIAQFGRTGLITEVAKVLIVDFVRNAETRLAGSAQPAAAGARGESPPRPASDAAPTGTPINGFVLILRSLSAWVRSWFSKAWR
jgi:uncharacterized protein